MFLKTFSNGGKKGKMRGKVGTGKNHTDIHSTGMCKAGFSCEENQVGTKFGDR